MTELKKKTEKKIVIKTRLELVNEAEAREDLELEVCPECGEVNSLMMVGHCKTCLLCGWSLCSL